MSTFQQTLVRRNAIRSPSKRSFAIDRLSCKLMGLGLSQSQHCQGQILSYQSGKVEESDFADTTLSPLCCSYPESSDEIDIDELYAECFEPWGSPVTSVGEASGSEIHLGASSTSFNNGVTSDKISRLQERGRRAPKQPKLLKFIMCETMDIKLGLGPDHDSDDESRYVYDERDNCDHLQLPNGDPDDHARFMFFRERLWEKYGEWRPETHLGYQPYVKREVPIKKKRVMKPSRLGRYSQLHSE